MYRLEGLMGGLIVVAGAIVAGAFFLAALIGCLAIAMATAAFGIIASVATAVLLSCEFLCCHTSRFIEWVKTRSRMV
jgi:hypothetical protein